jgi:uncharacterized protein YidB (DUF937 family)
MQNVLMGLLGGNQGSQNQQYQNLQYQNQQSPSQGAGLSGLLGSFAAAGLGQIAQSWVQSGPNRPVSPTQLQSVFGQQRVDQMAQQAGMPQQDFLSQLSEHLPSAVDRLTPEGRLPDEGTVSV